MPRHGPVQRLTINRPVAKTRQLGTDVSLSTSRGTGGLEEAPEQRPSPEVPAVQMQGVVPQGTLTSPSFKFNGTFISFLIGGGCDINFVRAELIIGSQVRAIYVNGSCKL